MAELKTRPEQTTGRIGGRDDMRARARDAFKVSVKQIASERKLVAGLGELGDLEMMEAASELTRKK